MSSWKARTSTLWRLGKKKAPSSLLKWRRSGHTVLAVKITDRTVAGLTPLGRKLSSVNTNGAVTASYSTSPRT